MRLRRGLDALVFDMDGVLLDTRPSFTRAVLLAAADCAAPPGLGPGWGEAEVETLRLCGGFNNDWDAATAMALLGPGSGPGRGWGATCAALGERGGGARAARELAGDLEWDAAWPRVVRRSQELYAGPRSEEVYGVAPREPRGLFELEVPLVTARELERTGFPFGVFTGRSPGELRLGLGRLELDLPAGRCVCDEAPENRKPGPAGLLHLARALGARRLVHVGDTVDDLRACQAAREEGLDALFAGVAAPSSTKEALFRNSGSWWVGPSVRALLRDLFDGEVNP